MLLESFCEPPNRGTDPLLAYKLPLAAGMLLDLSISCSSLGCDQDE